QGDREDRGRNVHRHAVTVVIRLAALLVGGEVVRLRRRRGWRLRAGSRPKRDDPMVTVVGTVGCSLPAGHLRARRSALVRSTVAPGRAPCQRAVFREPGYSGV